MEEKRLKDSPEVAYQYHRWVDTETMDALKKEAGNGPFWCTVASLIAGCVRLDTVLFQAEGSQRLGYDVLVRESISSEEWICYDSPTDAASLDEEQMLAVLERVVRESGLSYTAPSFPVVEPKGRKAR